MSETAAATNVDALGAAYAAFAGGDAATVFALLDPAIEWNVPESLPVGGVYRGHDEVAAFFGRLSAALEEVSQQPEHFVDGGDRVVVLGTRSGRGPGGSYTVPFADVWEFRDGRATRYTELIDTAVVAHAMGAGRLREAG